MLINADLLLERSTNSIQNADKYKEADEKEEDEDEDNDINMDTSDKIE